MTATYAYYAYAYGEERAYRMSERWKETTDPADHPDSLEDWCRKCGRHLGYGVPLFHLELCEDCANETLGR